MDLKLDDREDEEVEIKGDFDPDVASMRSKMGEAKEELEEEKLMFLLFKTPREIIDKFRAFERQAKEMAKSTSNGKQGTPMETDQGGESGNGTKTGGKGKGDAQGGTNDGSKKTDVKDNDDDMSIKSQE